MNVIVVLKQVPPQLHPAGARAVTKPNPLPRVTVTAEILPVEEHEFWTLSVRVTGEPEVAFVGVLKAV